MRLLLALASPFLIALAETPGRVEIQILYDNTSARPELEADWGFSALVTAGAHRVLLDTGARERVFLKNLAAMGVDPASIEHLVISHEHLDHLGGMNALLKLNPNIAVHRPKLGQGPFEIVPGVYSTGALPGIAAEQALVLETPKGLAVITGCSHPGVVALVEAAEKQRNANSVRLLVGGYHLLTTDAAGIDRIIASLRKLNVAEAVATHCSGVPAAKMFRAEFGPGPGAGAGARIVLE